MAHERLSKAVAGRLDPQARAALGRYGRVGAAGRQRVVDRWSWKYCAQLTVDQYREVLAMPQNIEKLRRNGRIA